MNPKMADTAFLMLSAKGKYESVANVPVKLVAIEQAAKPLRNNSRIVDIMASYVKICGLTMEISFFKPIR
jgi:hypothetical protein